MGDDAPVQDPQWKWYVGMAPAIGWDMVFEGPVDLLETLPERIRIRKASKAHINGKVLNIVPWAVWFFGLISGESEAVIDRKLFVIIQPLEELAAADARKSWVKEPPPENGVIVVDEEEAAEKTQQALAQAQAKVAMAKAIRSGPKGPLKLA